MKRLIIFLMAILPMAFVLSTAEAKPNKQKVVLYVYLHCQDLASRRMTQAASSRVSELCAKQRRQPSKAG